MKKTMSFVVTLLLTTTTMAQILWVKFLPSKKENKRSSWNLPLKKTKKFNGKKGQPRLLHFFDRDRARCRNFHGVFK